jgi:hypothetical protein
VSPAGEITLAATFADSGDVPGAAAFSQPQGTDAFVARYPAGYRPGVGNATWVQHLGDAGEQAVTTLALAEGGDVYVGGTYTKTLQSLPSLSLSKVGLDVKTGFVIRLGAADGAPVAGVERVYPPVITLEDVEIKSVATGPGGLVAVAGWAWGATDFGAGPEPLQDNTEGFFARYTSSLGYLSGAWLSDANQQRADHVAFGPAGDLYVAGSFINTIGFGGTVKLTQTDRLHGFLAHLDPAGTPQAAIVVGDEDGNLRAALHVAAAPGGDVVFAGMLSGHVAAGDKSVDTQAYDAVAGRVDKTLSAGRWAYTWGDGAEQSVDALAVGRAGQAVLAGHYDGTFSADLPATGPGVFVVQIGP